MVPETEQRARPLRRALRADSGAATAETAVVLIAVFALLALIVSLGGLFVSHARLSEGARTAAREMMISADPQEAIAKAQVVSGDGASFNISTSGDWVTVNAHATWRVGGPVLGMTFPLEASAHTRLEPHLVRNGP
ncbi:pilus assembly protein [Dermabacter vaginalis]|uniref:TadE/TadG family type IV pilus assembly protein n=1 Tax=Dermabacter vaginalis TaxID=1630135 RepID=UPI0021A5F455|nr:TadE/TadG family type IV pilus assembly protein [Dermabacter vaginalis]MCT2150528.1 pilus assembly protein [Dermabacter vaginalis]